ncbi:fumarylacetoacetate hydrolase [Biscogniauxia mediterranea]|nr:fumarylacetoacetate hydrolase [Biscogniauxia mediterranea]
MLHMAIKCAGLCVFVARQDGLEYIGEPVDEARDIGAALATSLDVDVRPTSNIRTIERLLPPLSRVEVDGQADYEAELAVVIAKHDRNVPVEDALDYVLGCTCSNDVCHCKETPIQRCAMGGGSGKGFDGFAPIGPCLVSTRRVPDPGVVGGLKTVLNGEVVQKGRADDMIFTIPKIIAYLSQGTTIESGTGRGKDLRMVMSHGLGSLVNYVEYGNTPEGGKQRAPSCSNKRTCTYW